MIIMRSDYSPSAASELQEKDNVIMVFAALHCTDMPVSAIARFREINDEAVDAYTKALGEPIKEDGTHTKDQWDAAVVAHKARMKQAITLLVDAGVTIGNQLEESESEGFFSHIATTIYKGFAEARRIAERDAKKLKQACGEKFHNWNNEEWREYLIHFGFCLAQQKEKKQKIEEDHK